MCIVDCYSFVLNIFPGNIFAYEIITQYTEKHVLGGGNVTLSCNYVRDNIRSWQWYKQYSNTAPGFIWEAFENLGPKKKDRNVAEAHKDKKQVHLKISKTEIADSAVYYCALVPTVTGNKYYLTLIIIFIS